MKLDREFEKCIKRRSLTKWEADGSVVKQELEAAEYDLRQARRSSAENDHKWAIIQSYYTIFHCVKALVYNKGYKERSHYCLLIALRHLYCDSGELDLEFAEMFENVMDLREEADYRMKVSREGANNALSCAEQFLELGRRTVQ